MRSHAQTAGVSLTAQQPLNNIMRTAIEALAGVLGGTQSLHTNSYDEALALPTEDAVRIALRTQQVIAHETGVANTIDPLGGSYFVEALTDEIEARALRVLRARSTSSAGWSRRSSATIPQREIADAAFELQQRDRRGRADRRRRQRASPRATTASCRSCASTRRSSASRSTACRRVRARRDGAAVERALGALRGGRRAGPTPT